MEKISWHVERRRINDLTPSDINPRQISKDALEQLKRSLEKFHYAELIVCQPDGYVIAGHMRLKAMQQLGWGKREIDVRIPNRELDESEFKEYMIRSNKNTGDWDYDKLANEWELQDLYEWGFNAEDLGFALDKDEPEEKEEGFKCEMCGQKIRKKNGT